MSAFNKPYFRSWATVWVFLIGVLLLLPLGNAMAQQAIIEGIVIDADTGEPLPGTNVLIEGTPYGASTDLSGEFRIVISGDKVTNEPINVSTRYVGYRAAKQTITLTATLQRVTFALEQDIFRLEEIVVTGVAGEIERAKLPFTVERLGEADLQTLTHTSVGTMVQGKVAGVTVVQGSGRPGAAPSFLLRGPTSIDASGRDQEPLYIVDGIILSASMVDMDALDIESIEIVKGAAASSMYGSQAASGVIQVTTRRGRRSADNAVRYTVRSEVGQSQLVGTFPLANTHQYYMHPDDPTKFYDNVTGLPVDYLDAQAVRYAGQKAPIDPATGLPQGNVWNTYMGNQWPQTYDHINTIFEPKMTYQNYLSTEGRSGNTNFHASLSHLKDPGVIYNLDGFERFNFRLNLDQRVRANLNLSGTAFISRSTDDLFTESQGNVLFRLTRMPAGVDLKARDENGEYYIRPDPQKENDNPLYELENRNWDRTRSRYLGSVNLRYTPLNWFLLEADASFDRLVIEDEDFYDRGYRTARPSSVNTGHVYKSNSNDESVNTSTTATLLRNFGGLNTTTQARALYQEQRFRWQYGYGYELGASGIPSLHNVGGTPTVRSAQGTVKYAGYFLITNLDFQGRYILDLLARRDGSSLFGEDERWQTYYRAAAAWRLTQEPWFQIDALDEMKLRYSLGTAGGRPNFAAQYETYSVAGGVLTPVTIGNKNLKPEYAVENELGLEIGFLNRFSLDVTYAASEVDDQILRVPLPGYTGFTYQWQNAGTLESNTIEISLNSFLVRQKDFSWSARVLFDRTSQEISKLNVPDFTYGVAGQAMDKVFYAREGEKIGTFYGYKWARDISDLHPDVQAVDGVENLFQKNDDGFLVYVGDGNTWRDGWTADPANHLWGTTASVGGQTFRWGTPSTGWGTDRISGESTQFLPIGSTTPEYRFAISTNMNYKQFGLYILLDSEQNFSVWNQPLQWSVFEEYASLMDQSGKSDETIKPIGYYSALYNTLSPPNDYWIEDGSYVKLREITLRYSFTQKQLAMAGLGGILNGATISLSGRNLYTWTNYRGYDPEIGRSGGDVGSAAIARVDGYQYPNFRTWRFGLEFNL